MASWVANSRLDPAYSLQMFQLCFPAPARVLPGHTAERGCSIWEASLKNLKSARSYPQSLNALCSGCCGAWLRVCGGGVPSRPRSVDPLSFGLLQTFHIDQFGCGNPILCIFQCRFRARPCSILSMQSIQCQVHHPSVPIVLLGESAAQRTEACR